MEINSIEQLKTIRDQIRDKIKLIDKGRFIDQKFGQENEYTYRGMIGGIDSLLTDISTLIKSPSQFIKISTYNERVQILSMQQQILRYIEDPPNLWQILDSLKIHLRQYNIRFYKERFLEFNEELDNMVVKKEKFSTILDELKSLIDNSNVTKNEIDLNFQEIVTKKEAFESKLDQLLEIKSSLEDDINSVKDLYSELDLIKEKSNLALKGITESYNESKSNEKLINSFAEKVYEREIKFDEIVAVTNDYNLKLKEYTDQREDILKNANSLIESAKLALNYKTAEGISASFQAQYENAKNSFHWAWLVGSILGILISILIGVWVVIDNTTPPLSIIIGRISLLPFPISASIFCATQFVRQKNIIEDYAYKMVLSKSIVGFSEQIRKNGSKENEEYIHYIKKVLEEIHKDPLRKRDDSKGLNFSRRDLMNFEKILDLTQKYVQSNK